MFSAFLQNGDGSWGLCEKMTEVIDHVGDILVSESKEEQDINLELLGTREGKEVKICYHKVIMTDVKLWDNEGDAYEELMTTGEALVEFTHYFHPIFVSKEIGNVQTYEGWNVKENAKWEGVVGISKGEHTLLRRDEALWDLANEATARQFRKKERDLAKQMPNKSEFDNLVGKCAKALGVSWPDAFKVEQLWTWLAAHDAAFGKRATNKLALQCAKRWCNNRAKSKKWMNRWSPTETAERTDLRLAAVCRLGARNSRHDKKA